MIARGRPIAALFIAALFIVTVSATVGLVGKSAAYSPVEISLSAPSFAGASQKVTCTLTISGGPAAVEGTNYSYKAEIVADNKTGSSVTPTSGSSASGVFNLTITMPGEAQTIKVRINATSKAIDDDSSVVRIREFEIDVVEPIEIKATVYNTGVVDAKNVTAEFFADGILLGSKIFNVSAGSSQQLSHNWTWANIADGKHTISIVIDDPNGIVEFSDGNNVFTQVVYVGSQSNPIGAVLTIGVLIMSVLVGLTIMTKPQRRKK